MTSASSPTMNSRERVLTALRHQEPDRVPIDLDGMRSTGITAIAYNRLCHHLGLAAGPAQVYDLSQQLARPAPAMLERFQVDVRPLNRLPLGLNPTNEQWKPWTLPDGSPARVPAGFAPVRDERSNLFVLDEDGRPVAKMPAGGLYFDTIYHPLAEATTIAEIEAVPLPLISDAELDWLRRQARHLHETTDKVIVGEFGGSIVEAAQGLRGWGRFLMDLLAEPKLAQTLMERLADNAIANLERYLPAVGEYIQIVQMGDDLGTQQGPQMSPALYRQMVWPHHRRIYQHAKARSNLYVFLHSCGSVAALIPDLIEAGVDILNPVQVSAAGMDPAALKREFENDLAFWGGGCDTQMVLPQATPAEVRQHVQRQLEILAPGGGYVFAAVHNIQPDAPPENVVAMYDAALEFGQYA